MPKRQTNLDIFLQKLYWFFANKFFIFYEEYLLQYFNTFYYPIPPKTDGYDLQKLFY